MPVTDRSQAKSGGWQQVRAAIQSFEADVTNAEFGEWGQSVFEGERKKPKEFFEITTTNVNVLEVSEPLAFEPEEFNFRINCSDYNGSFWIDAFLGKADELKLAIPDDIIGKRVRFKKEAFAYEVTDRQTKEKKSGTKFDWVIDAVLGDAGSPSSPSPVSSSGSAPTPTASNVDPMIEMLELAVGKTENQFRSAVGLNPAFPDYLKSLAKAGAITETFIKEGKLTLVKDGNKEVYQKP